MKSKIDELGRVRKKLGKWLRNHDTIHGLASSVNKVYYSATDSKRMLPNFLIIGAARCGTTSLYEYLIQHPCILEARGKEVYFFDKKFSKGVNWYRSFFPFSHNPKSETFCKKFITGEATPRYLYHPHAPKRIFKVLPNVKLIVLLRNPVDRAYSHYQMEVDHNHETSSFEEATEQEESRIKDDMVRMEKDENFYSVEFYRKSYLTRGVYVEQIKRWFQFFPREQFLILKSEDFYSKTSKVYNQVLAFLDLPKFELDSYKQFKKRKYSSINPGTRKKLIEFFRLRNKQLYELLDTNFNWDDGK